MIPLEEKSATTLIRLSCIDWVPKEFLILPENLLNPHKWTLQSRRNLPTWLDRGQINQYICHQRLPKLFWNMHKSHHKKVCISKERNAFSHPRTKDGRSQTVHASNPHIISHQLLLQKASVEERNLPKNKKTVSSTRANTDRQMKSWQRQILLPLVAADGLAR